MFKYIRSLLSKRALTKIKGNSLNALIQKLQLLSSMAPYDAKSTYELDECTVRVRTVHLPSLPMTLTSLAYDIVNHDNLHCNKGLNTLYQDSFYEWCLDKEGRYVSGLELLEVILIRLQKVKASLEAVADDTLYVEYALRQMGPVLEDLNEYVRAIAWIYLKIDLNQQSQGTQVQIKKTVI